MQGQLSGCFTSKTFQYPLEDSTAIMFRSQKGELGHIDVNFSIPDDCAHLPVGGVRNHRHHPCRVGYKIFNT